MSYEQILFERRGTVALVTLNRPEKLNAWTEVMRSELCDALARINEDPALGAAVLTGAGRGFCAGADIEAVFEAGIDGEPATPGSPDAVRPDWVRLVRESKPLIAAVNGVAVGVGITQILPFDVLVASTEAKVGMFFVRMGLVPELASSQLLVQRVGFALASEMCLTGRLYDARELEGRGLFNAVVEPGELIERALAVAEEIAANAPSSLRAVKRLLTANAAEQDLDLVQQREMAELHLAYRTPEHREAVAAFLEKRAPVFVRS
ncbi:MAG TPA: enoyl-CoA hydratase-related protein [Thermoanaerobaculia bacterium]|nr:enoyl-CoA hydratase-related protein [Thermoanaerobaculia bacterium]